MKINVTENKVSIKEEQILNENEYNIHKIQFDFSSEYTDDLVKVALFSIDNHTYKKIISNNECDIPPEVLIQRGYSILGVYAYKTEQDTLVLRYSPSPTRISVYDGSYKADAENSEPITPSEIEQYQQILQNSLQQFQNQYNALVEETEGDIQAIEDELQRKVDEGYFDGEDGFSPIAKVIQKSNGATIEIEDKNGKTTADVLNGEDGYTPVRGVDYWTEEDKQEVEEEATQQIEGKIEEYNENAAEKLNQYNQNSVQKTNDYNTNAEQKMSAYNTNATEKLSTYNSNATEKFNDYNSNAEQKETNYNTNASSKLSEYNSNAETKKSAYNENATQKTNSFNTNATNKLTEYNTNHTEKMSAYNSNSTQKLNAFNENATQKTEDFDEHTEEIQDNIEILQRTDNQILSRFNKDEEVSGQDITLTGTTEIKFAKPPLPMGNSEQDGEPSPDNEVPISNVTGDVEVKVQNKNIVKINNVSETSINGMVYSIENGVLKINGTANKGTTIVLANNIFFKKGTYTHSINDIKSAMFFSFDNLSNTMLRVASGTKIKNITFQLAEDTIFERYILWVDNGTSFNNEKFYLQTEPNSTSTPYTPHKEQTFTFPLGNEKLMLGDYLADDGIHHVRGQVVFDGSENWLANGESTDYGQYVYLLNTKAYGTTNLISDKFLTKRGNDGNYISGRDANKYIAISIAKNIVTYGANQFKTWLSTHNVTVEYELEEEVIVPYTSAQQRVYNEIKNAYSYDEMTIITGSSDGNKPFFTVQTYKDINKELNNKVDKVAGKELSTNDFTDEYKEQVDTNTEDIEDIQEEQTEQNTEIENLQEENARLKATLPTTTGEGQDITLDKTAEFEFVKPPLPMGNSEQDGEPSPDNEVPISNVTGNVEVTISNENNTESKTLSVSLGNIELCKIGNYQDYIYKNEGNWYVHKNIIKIDLSTITSYIHTSGWRNLTAFVADNVFYHEYSGYTTVASLFCNRLIADTPARITGSVINAIGLGRNSSMYISVEGITTSNALITYFSQNPTYLYAPLATPTDTEITDTTLISQLEEISKTLSYQGQTNITSNTIALFDVEAYQSTKLVLQNLDSRLTLVEG